MHSIRRGNGKPLLLIHGLGGTWRSWTPVLGALAASREVIAVDLPGHGDTPRLDGETSIATLADAVTQFLRERDLTGIDAAGSSMGARLVLELARRGGVLGSVVSLDPGGFWRGWERHAFFGSLALSIRIVRALQPVLERLTRNPIGRTLLLAQLSSRPWRIAPELALDELRGYAGTPVFHELLWQLAYGEEQRGAPAGSIRHPLVIGWGRRDRVCFRWQARRALALFPDARLHRFARCGHFPQWDDPQATTRLILQATAGIADATWTLRAGRPDRRSARPLPRRPHLATP